MVTEPEFLFFSISYLAGDGENTILPRIVQFRILKNDMPFGKAFVVSTSVGRMHLLPFTICKHHFTRDSSLLRNSDRPWILLRIMMFDGCQEVHAHHIIDSIIGALYISTLLGWGEG